MNWHTDDANARPGLVSVAAFHRHRVWSARPRGTESLTSFRFGWAADNLWPIVTSLIFTPIVNEFGPSRPPLLQLAQNIGLLAGAMFWGKQTA